MSPFKSSPQPPPNPQPVPSYMLNPFSSSYKANFQALDEFEDTHQRTKHVWKIKIPLSTDPFGQPKVVSTA